MRIEIKTHDGAKLCECRSIDDVEMLRSGGLVPDGATVTAVYDVADFDAAIADHINAVAREADFIDANDAAGFAQSTQAVWSADALAFIAWRDSVWLAFEAAKTNLPASPEAFIASLTAIDWQAYRTVQN